MSNAHDPWDDWCKTCGQPTVWTGFDWPEPVETYVVLPVPTYREDEVERLRNLIAVLLDNDPDEPIADNGMTVLDGWREQARRALGRLPGGDWRDDIDEAAANSHDHYMRSGR